MKDNLKDILGNLNPGVDQETLLRYLQGHLPADQQQELEAQLIDSDFESDALDGLQEFSDKRQLAHLVEQLNADLRKKTEKRRKRRLALQGKGDPGLWMAVLIILLLVVICYLVVRARYK
ncbi:MAG: hypothetical protein JWP27_563 [Flaviaesturariibacter sp.]|nr:hypothetical protein [Flaviaesturariibacter sp.]